MAFIEFRKEVANKGWFVNFDKVADHVDRNATISTLMKQLLNLDLREIAEKGLPANIIRFKDETINGPIVLQVAKIRNVAVQKAYEGDCTASAKRILKLTVTDGNLTCNALERNILTDISIATPPGTKIQLTGCIRVVNGILMLDRTNTRCLNGTVPKLVSKWQLTKETTKCSQNRPRDGPPPWVPFGQKIKVPSAVASKATPKPNPVKEATSEFDQRRLASIAKAEKLKQQTQPEYTVAISNPNTLSVGAGATWRTRPGNGGSSKARVPPKKAEEEYQQSHPSSDVALFDFIKPKMNEEKTANRKEEFLDNLSMQDRPGMKPRERNNSSHSSVSRDSYQSYEKPPRFQKLDQERPQIKKFGGNMNFQNVQNLNSSYCQKYLSAFNGSTPILSQPPFAPISHVMYPAAEPGMQVAPYMTPPPGFGPASDRNLSSIQEGVQCQAIYYPDGLFYMAEVVQVMPEEGKCAVFYLDYGNTDIVNMVDVKLPQRMPPPGTYIQPQLPPPTFGGVEVARLL